MKAQHNASAIQQILSGDPSGRAEAIESLLAQLLAEHLGRRSRATDGYVALREESSVITYFSVGKLWMVDDQSSHPVSLRLKFDAEGGLRSGVIYFGFRSKHGLQELSPKDENVLSAFPEEATSRFDWAYVLEYDSGKWRIRQAAEQ